VILNTLMIWTLLRQNSDPNYHVLKKSLFIQTIAYAMDTSSFMKEELKLKVIGDAMILLPVSKLSMSLKKMNTFPISAEELETSVTI